MKVTFTIIINLIIYTYSFCLFAQNKTSVYVSPHQDDWQLFMNPNAYKSVKNPDEKVIFIHTTAGDAATGPNSNFFLAREEGSLRAIRFMSNTFTSGSGLGSNMNETIVTINGHDIVKYSYRNSVAYFLRLPDGNVDGSGYTIYDYKCLEKLYNGSISNISTINNNTTYTSLADLEQTLKLIVELESANLNNLTFNMADDNNSINPGDHSDHVYSSKIMQNVANSIGGVTLNLYSEYDTSLRGQNVFDDDYLVSAGTWGVTTSGISDNFHYSTWDARHNSWIGRQYYRSVPPLNPNNPNIALNKPTSSSSNEPNNVSSNANDNDYSLSSYWGANPYSQWWQVDLQNIYDVNKVVVTNYYDGARYYQYNIQGSLDGINWSTIVDFNDNTTPANSQGNSFDINTTARYLRVNMNFNSANIGVHIVEFEAYGGLNSDFTNKLDNLFLSPNPIDKGDDIIIELDFPIKNTIFLEVSDFNGVSIINKKIKQTNVTNNISLNTSLFKKGLNIIKLTIEGKTVSKKVFIK